ncbi:UDP-glucuronate decarboxylase [Roseinatronobacter thiooxidans]|uniref:UDP-glucuronate decarboxylase n=1 Tax=Roseinatronobacter thiooxidans TaxID=121821 RepID=A0A2W7QWB1_9RHOB|nr:UDP-glucuronic acid decarboxylase family protein [Roseinatronobacter thiooxidans]PZX45909.1 UDP-glucuronate decarboxylase [Roseinatronobacter thiooxidans]
MMTSARSMKTVLVAGGAGFLGSRLCTRLLMSGADVICVDNLQTGYLSNIDLLTGQPNFSFIKHDITFPLTLRKQVDEIYNLACPASPPMYQIDPIHTLKTCVLGALNLLDLARDNGATILQASTSEVYGDPLFSPQAEGYHGNVNPVGPRACYDEGKRAAETLFHDYSLQHGVTVKIARIFNTYGPGMSPNDGRVVSNFAVQALRGEPITIYGDGAQTRSFCYVDDLLDGLIALMATPDDVNYPVNLGNDGEFTIADLARLILNKTGSTSKIVYNPIPVDDPQQRRPDLGLAKMVLGWQPKVTLEEGLNATIPWFRSQLKANSHRAESAA